MLFSRTPIFAAFCLLKLQIVGCYGLLWRSKSRPGFFSVVGQELFVIGFFAIICCFAQSNTNLYAPVIRLSYALGLSYSLIALANNLLSWVKQK